jgi:hypothetical protein
MHTSEIVAALNLLGKIYTNKDGSKPSIAITKVLDFLNSLPEGDIVSIAHTGKTNVGATTKTRRKPLPSNADAIISKLETASLSDHDLGSLLHTIEGFRREDVLSLQQRFSPKRGVKTKKAALEDIRNEFFRRARAVDRLRQSETGPLI